jgi:hypothetical protein
MRRNRLAAAIQVLRAYGELIYFDMYLSRGNFAALYNKIRALPVENHMPDPRAVATICRAVDVACICYWKRVLCLQRSAATASLLKKNGVPATLVLGAKQMPFKAHAWVEVESCVVNDKPYMHEIYTVLDRC